MRQAWPKLSFISEYFVGPIYPIRSVSYYLYRHLSVYLRLEPRVEG